MGKIVGNECPGKKGVGIGEALLKHGFGFGGVFFFGGELDYIAVD